MFRHTLGRRLNMYAVGRLGNYISQGVYTVAGPFHPFGGAVDIIVVQQEDGTYKSSPWYVKFGKFQGVLKRSEKLVHVAINDEAVKFHMYLDATGEAYFLKDVEPETEESSSSHSSPISSGDEVSVLKADANKLEDGLESKVIDEDVEKGESSDEKDSNLALRFEGRKASYLLVQQARAAEEANSVVPENGTSKVEDTDIQSNIGREPSKELLSSLAALKLKNSSVVELENASGGSAIHTLLNQAAGLDQSQKPGRPSASLFAQAALASVAKAATKESSPQPNDINRSQSESGLGPGSTERLESVDSKDKEGLLEGREVSAAGSENVSAHIIQVVRDGREIIAEGVQLGKSESLNFRTGQSTDDLVRLKRARSESDLRLYETGDTSPEVSTLMITSADGIVVLHTPRQGSPPPLIVQDGNLQDHRDANVTERDDLEISGTRNVETQTSISTLELLPLIPLADTSLAEKNAEKALGDLGAGVISDGPEVSTSLSDASVYFSDGKNGIGKPDAVNNATVLSRTALHSPSSAREVDHGLADVLQIEEAAVGSSDMTPDSNNLYSKSDIQDLVSGLEKTSKGFSSKNGLVKSNGTLFKEDEKPVPEKRQASFDSNTREKKARTMEQKDEVADRMEGPGASETGRPSSVELISSPKLKAAVERELAWRDAVHLAAAALKVAPLSANTHRTNRHTDRKLSSGGTKNSPKRKSSSEHRSGKNSVAAAGSNSELSSQRKSDTSEILPEHAEKRSWGWWGWRGSTPSRPTSELGDKKDMKEVKDLKEESSAGELKSQNGDGNEAGDELEEGSVGSKVLQKGGKAAKELKRDAEETSTVKDAGELRETSHEENETGKLKLNEGDMTKQETPETKSKGNQEKVNEKKGKDEQTSSRAAQKPGTETEMASRRRSLLGLVFRGYDKEPAAADAQSALDNKGGNEGGSSVEGKESESHPVLVKETFQTETEKLGDVEDSQPQSQQDMAPLDKVEVRESDTKGAPEVLQADGVTLVSRESLSKLKEDEAHSIQSFNASVDSSLAEPSAEPASSMRRDDSSSQLVDTIAGEEAVGGSEEELELDLERNRFLRTSSSGDNAVDINAASSDSIFESPSAELRDSLTTFRGDEEALGVYDSSPDIDIDKLSRTNSRVSPPLDSPPECKKEVSFAVSVHHGSSGESFGEELHEEESGSLDNSPVPGDDHLAGDPAPEVVIMSGNGLVLSLPADSIDDRKPRFKNSTAQATTSGSSAIDNHELAQEHASENGQVEGTMLAAGGPLVYATDSNGYLSEVVTSPGIKDFLDTLRSKGDSVAAGRIVDDRDLDQDESGSEEQEERYLSYDRRIASSRSIYFDANTSDEDEEDARRNLSGGDGDPESTWARSNPVSIPGARVNSNTVFLVGEDGNTLWPLSESMPLDRTQYTDAEMTNLKTGLSRSLGSEPLALVQSSTSAKSASADLPRCSNKGSPTQRLESDAVLSKQPGDELSEEEVGESDEEEKVPETGIELSLCKHLLKERMGSENAAIAFNSAKISLDDFRSNGASIVTNDKLIVRVGGQYYPWTAAAPLVLGMLAFGQVVSQEIQGAIQVEKPDPSPSSKDVGALVTTGSGGWKLWPFPLRRPKTPERNGAAPLVSREALMVAAGAGVDSALMNDLVSHSDYYLRSRKHRVRSYLPTSQMLASMNLKEGSNRITFTFVTRVLGRQQVDARIYLWKWNTRVVISDVDGTITKSDVLGQVMPLVGKDWTQSGVTRLFSAIKENGYEVMFLSARAISQAYLTRQFLFNLKQDGEALPDGPVVISPDGLFPSLYREVIRRAPHEFKIACLQDIRDLFPKDCNPFYAGFGNRDTDEISYLKVGIPKGKIFIINPKGEVAVNNRVDVKSYTSLHKLVDDMFPPQTYTEQEAFNSWNFWKMPIPDVDDDLSVKSGSKKSNKSKS